MFIYKGGVNSDEYAPIVEKWLEENLHPLDRKYYAYIAICDDLELRGVIIYTDCTEFSINMDVYTPRCMSRRTIREMLTYPFVQLGLNRVFGTIDCTNKIGIDVFTKIGFYEVARIPDIYGPHADRLVLCADIEAIKRWVN